jgi:hypothetical protein
MAKLFNFHFDLISFWLGILTAICIGWIFYRIRPYFPVLLKEIRKRIENNRRKSEDRLAEYLRNEVYRRAQGMHLAASLCPLDEVLIEPFLLAPPAFYINPEANIPNTITEQVIPYLPDWPEITAPFRIKSLSAAQAMQKGVRIAITGQPGSGKTVTLAHLASQVAKNEPAVGILADMLPMLVHALDLSLNDNNWKENPLLPLIKAVSAQSSVLVQSQIPKFLHFSANKGRCLLLLDGLDELPPEQIQEMVRYLKELIQRYPGLYIIVTAAPQYMDGLGQCGFLPLTVTGWGHAQKEQFIQKWSQLWKIYPGNEIMKNPEPASTDPRIISGWLFGESANFSPLEWTLKVWGAFAGDLCGPTGADAVLTYLRRITPPALPDQALSKVAYEWIRQEKAGLSFSELEEFLSRLKLPIEEEFNLAALRPDEFAQKQKPGSKKKEKRVSSAGRVIDLLIENGLFVEHTGEILRFSNPVFTAFLAAETLSPEKPPELESLPVWSVKAQWIHDWMRNTQDPSFINRMLAVEDNAIFSRLLQISRGLKDAPVNLTWRPILLRRLVTLLQREDLPFSVRCHFLGALIISNDSSLALLFKQFMISESPRIRQLAVLGLASLNTTKAQTDLAGMLADPIPEVRFAACLALTAANTPSTRETLFNVLLHGDEGLQNAAAEALSNLPEGIPLLQEVLNQNNIVVRRAVVNAFAQIQEPWVDALLEKIAIEDGQWIVRNAAVLAREQRAQPDPRIPAPLPAAVNAGWLITFASKQGRGISMDEQPVDLLLLALISGTAEEKLNALIYLRTITDDRVIQAVQKNAYLETHIASDAAVYALSQFTMSGAVLPATRI